MFDQKEAQLLVDSIAPGLSVAIETTQEPTYTLSPAGVQTPRLDATGEHIRHPIDKLHITLGKVTCTIDHAHGAASPHERVLRTDGELKQLIKDQVGNLIKESVRKPMSASEYQAWQAEQARQGVIRAAKANADRLAEELVLMPSDERAVVDYIAQHGEPPIEHHPHLHMHQEHLAAAVALGVMSEDEAAAEQKRIVEWKQRCESRCAVDATHKNSEEV